MKKNMEKINAQKKVNAEAIRHYTLAYAEYNSLPYGYKPARLSKGFEPIKPYSIGASLKSKTKGATENETVYQRYRG